MQFRHVNPHNVRWLVPSWAINPFDLARALEDMVGNYKRVSGRIDPNKQLKFWIIADVRGGVGSLDVREVDGDQGGENRGCLFITGDEWTINVPLNDILKGAPSLERSHCLYYHSFEVDCPLGYFGITKRPWYERLAQHQSSARNGSPYLVHRAMREHAQAHQLHRVLLAGLDHETAMAVEEQMVGIGTLYPLGLNMIPGGAAGIRYLASLGFHPKTSVERDDLVERLASRDTLEGRPNPLCAARWESDQDFVNRVICGHSGRLTVDQVAAIRSMQVTGANHNLIAATLGVAARKVRRVLTGAAYRRVV